jgi:hypothetical protein
MFDFINDPIAIMFLISSLILTFLTIYIWLQTRKMKVDKNNRFIKNLLIVLVPLLGGFLTLIAVGLFIFQSYVYYLVVLTGGAMPDSIYINDKYSEQRTGHFYSLYINDTSSLKDPYRGFYRAFEKRMSVKLIREHKVPFSDETFNNSYDTSHAYAEPYAISMREYKSVYTSTNQSGIDQVKEAGNNAYTVAESILKKKLPLDVFKPETNTRGDSAGLMLTLELIQQFGESDILKGYSVCGTGTINKEGNVGIIGGLKMKMIAAAAEDFDFCFIAKTNYSEAVKIITQNDLMIKIVPVSNIYEALSYLVNLDEKSGMLSDNK